MRAYLLLGLLLPLGCATTPSDAVRVVDNQLFRGRTPLTPRFAAIDSFDVSRDRREVVFSAKRTTNFDIGLVSLDGSEIHWVPEDPRDETAVQWAPRGNKISYVVRAAGGDVVRTVHIPTSMQLTADFPYASVRSLRWAPDGERYFVVVTSPDASDRTESMRYDGEERRVEIAPKVKLDVAVEPLAGGIVLRPAAIRYGETLPLVVWITPHLYAWSDARGALLQRDRVACVIVAKQPDDAFWQAVRAVPWIDAAKPLVQSAPE
ncbi:MAG TPA: hypothetical protein VI670_15070 [Thermoanaerobaculia bacterium]